MRRREVVFWRKDDVKKGNNHSWMLHEKDADKPCSEHRRVKISIELTMKDYARSENWRLVNNIFQFRFAAKKDKNRILAGDPWHFNRSFIVVTELVGIGDITKQLFTHVFFLVHLWSILMKVWIKRYLQVSARGR